MKGIFSAAVYSAEEGATASWVLVSTAMVFFMVVGHTLLESGLIRQKNSQFILVKNVLIVCVGILAWWLFGFGLAYGSPTKFVGTDSWFFANAGVEKMADDNYLLFIYEMVYALFTAILFTGPLSERAHMATYLFYAFIIVGYVYPIQCAWVWGGGWLDTNGFQDFAGSGVINMTAGVSGFWGAVILGERYGKDKQRKLKNKNLNEAELKKAIVGKDLSEITKSVQDLANKQDDFRPSSPLFMVVGTLILFTCWLFYTGGYDLFVTRDGNVPKVFVNTFLGGATGGITAMFMRPAFLRSYKHVSWYDTQSICNGVLAGLVSISASVNTIEGWAAICIAIIGATFYAAFCKYLEYRRIDDPTEGSAVHMICGMWGLLASGFFNNEFGVIYGDPAKGHYFGYQVCGLVAIFAWNSVISIPYFLVMQQIELFRIDRTLEVIGQDLAELGGITSTDFKIIKEEVKQRLEQEEKKEKAEADALLETNQSTVNDIKLRLKKAKNEEK